MRVSRLLIGAALAVVLGAGAVSQAIAWGASGHRMVGQLAVEGLPAEVPAFMRGKKAAADVGELAREPDRWKGSGKIHDTDRDAAHNLDLDDEGRVLGVMPLADLPPTREDYEKALQAAGHNSWEAGYLQYAIIDGYQQLTLDLANWRVLKAAEKRAKGARRAWYRADRVRREALILRDMGVLGHYVGDGSQPLHVSIHYNGWGKYPNPKGYTTDRIHGPFEGAFVVRAASVAGARAGMPAFHDCACAIEKRTVDYLLKTQTYLEPLYALWSQGGFKDVDPRGAAFVIERLGAGAAELRDLYVLAWRQSASSKVGWPAIAVSDVEAGRVDPWDSMLGRD